MRSFSLATAALPVLFFASLASADDVAEADAMMAAGGLSSYESAARIYEKALAAKPKEPGLALKTADALNRVMRIKTDGAVMTIDGLRDSKANKEIWASMGKRAVDAAAEAKKLDPKNVAVAATYAEAYLYYSSSFGLMQQILKGAGPAMLKNAEDIIALDPKYDGGGAYCYKVGFYIVAPWPLGDIDKARDFGKKALAVAPDSPRNNYFMALVEYHDDNREAALTYFDKASQQSCDKELNRETCAVYVRDGRAAATALRGK